MLKVPRPESYNSDDSDSSRSIPDITKLKPYDFEPEASSSDDEFPTSLTQEKSLPDIRIGNTFWCVCGKCLPMDTYAESLCCRDTNEITDECFLGIFHSIIMISLMLIS